MNLAFLVQVFFKNIENKEKLFAAGIKYYIEIMRGFKKKVYWSFQKETIYFTILLVYITEYLLYGTLI